MDPPFISRYRLKYGGLVIATIGFFLTRTVVLETAQFRTPFPEILISAALPLVLGLVIILVGIGLAVSAHDREYVNTVATWCGLGTASMLVIVVFTTLQVSSFDPAAQIDAAVSRRHLITNVLLGGASGGLLIGFQSATNHRQRRKLVHEINRNKVLNRILRHEVLNKTNIINGNVDLLASSIESNEQSDDTERRIETIRDGVTHITETINEIGFLVKSESNDPPSGVIDLSTLLSERVERFQREYPEADVTLHDEFPAELPVRANDQLSMIIDQLVTNAIEHSDAKSPRVDITVESDDVSVRFRISDNGPGMPPDQQAILLDGELPEYDDPTTGFGLPIVRLLADQNAASLDVETGTNPTSGTTVTVELLRPTDPDAIVTTLDDQYGVALWKLGRVSVAAILAGIAMGLILQSLTETLPAIGGLYGVSTVTAGWILHLFHSVVFGMLFVAAISRPGLSRYASRFTRCTMLGLGYGILLWIIAAGLVMPVWLNLVGIASPVPSLTLPSFLGHAVWGGLLGGAYNRLS